MSQHWFTRDPVLREDVFREMVDCVEGHCFCVMAWAAGRYNVWIVLQQPIKHVRARGRRGDKWMGTAVGYDDETETDGGNVLDRGQRNW